MFETNQYPASFYSNLIRDILKRLLNLNENTECKEVKDGMTKMFFFNSIVVAYQMSRNRKFRKSTELRNWKWFSTTRKPRTVLQGVKMSVLTHKSLFCVQGYLSWVRFTPVWQRQLGNVSQAQVKICWQTPRNNRKFVVEAIPIAKLKPAVKSQEEFRRCHSAMHFFAFWQKKNVFLKPAFAVFFNPEYWPNFNPEYCFLWRHQSV